MVSLLIVSLFVGVTMQAIMIAILLKARAEQYDAATTWIQEDLELVKGRASNYERSAYPYSSKCNATSAADGLAAGLLTDIGGTPKTDAPRLLGGTYFILNRTANYTNSSDPFKLLKLDYTVTAQLGSGVNPPPIVTLSTEVIADAAIKCP
jgi:hypothetical protein